MTRDESRTAAVVRDETRRGGDRCTCSAPARVPTTTRDCAADTEGTTGSNSREEYPTSRRRGVGKVHAVVARERAGRRGGVRRLSPAGARACERRRRDRRRRLSPPRRRGTATHRRGDQHQLLAAEVRRSRTPHARGARGVRAKVRGRARGVDDSSRGSSSQRPRGGGRRGLRGAPHAARHAGASREGANERTRELNAAIEEVGEEERGTPVFPWARLFNEQPRGERPTGGVTSGETPVCKSSGGSTAGRRTCPKE